ncbi:related to serine/threonine-protein kinase AKL1 [Zygosaccharomyces bailii]|nr:related to serine/threonine-protein kinase AKL1 [Zygosaccharomyces bailii]
MPATSGASSLNKPAVDGYAPGTVVSVGNQQVEVLSYLAEGGFAQIYSVKYLQYIGEFKNGATAPLKPGDKACLKRVLVPDESGLSEMRNEVEVMKQLRGAKNIIQYYDSNASRRSGGQVGFEVLLLMELCSNNSLLDYMNQRLATKLTEKEILKIMYDTTLAISQMHYLPVPLIHRDIKIENVLVDSNNNFKLCDFGSASTCCPLVTTHQDIAILTQNIYVNTTPQYRSPEMIDLYRCLPINEKSDIWALGIFLYKLLFFITPFEMTGQFAILHSKYEFPANSYSSKLINLIIIMLAENPYVRPNIYQVMHHICAVIGCEVPIEDKYASGPYNFEKYTEFQTKLQNVQYQMYLLQQKKLENHGYLNSVESKLLNDLIIASFEVSGKVPAEVGRTAPLKHKSPKPKEVNLNSSDESSDQRKSVFSSRNPSRNPSGASRKNTMPSSEFDNELDANLEAESKQFAAVSMSDREPHLSPHNQKSLSSYSSGGKSLSGGPHDKSSEALSGEQATKTEASPGAMKQHKSNNPFPMMAQGYSQPTPATTAPEPIHPQEYFLDDQQSFPQGQMRAHSPEDSHFKQPAPQIPHSIPVPPAQSGLPRSNYNQNMFYGHVDSPVSAHAQSQPTSFKKVPEATQPQMRFNYQVPQTQPSSSPYYPSPMQAPAKLATPAAAPMLPPPAQQPPKPPQPSQTSQQRSRPVPPQQSQHFKPVQPASQQVEQAMPLQPAKEEVAPPENPPPIPPHPRTWQDYTVSEKPDLKQKLNRRDEKTVPFMKQRSRTDSPLLEKTPSKNLDLTYNEMDLGSDDPKPKRSTQARREAFSSTQSDMASSESIEIDLDDAKRATKRSPRTSNDKSTPAPEKLFRHLNSSSGSLRQSLDLKYQEVHFSSPDLAKQAKETKRQDNGDQGGRRGHPNNHSDSNRRHSNNSGGPSNSPPKNEMERYKNTRKNNSNSSINVSGSTGSDMRKSFAKARQSLDLEKIRREAVKGEAVIAGKRRSLFSVFRGDKK